MTKEDLKKEYEIILSDEGIMPYSDSQIRTTEYVEKLIELIPENIVATDRHMDDERKILWRKVDEQQEEIRQLEDEIQEILSVFRKHSKRDKEKIKRLRDKLKITGKQKYPG